MKKRLHAIGSIVGWLALVVFGIWFFGTKVSDASYTEALEAIEADRVKEARIGPEELRLVLKDPAAKPIIAARIPNTDDKALLETLQRKKVAVFGEPERSGAWFWLWLAPLLGVGLFLVLPSFFGAAADKKLGFARSKPRFVDANTRPTATFADVAGVDEAKAELLEVVRFLEEPARFRAVGARIPKGVLLVGAPGTGKTLLARAVAGQAGVPFFSLSGSEFVEMFVGVGASRVRDLFEQAKAKAPSIVFIDELDAVGKARAGAQGFAANEEREQTLNQLLVEMDGFDISAGVVILAATNRPEILDRALLRAGRFDRQVVVDAPDLRGRRAILDVHAKKVVMGPDVDLGIVARRTPGMVGAELANVVNEAALAAVRNDRTAIIAADFDEAVDRMQLGSRKEGHLMTPAEKRRIAVHEGGHTVVALSVEHADPVERVTILPRSIGALGATLQLPQDDRHIATHSELADRLAILLAGSVAEELVCGDLSTGAADDLQRATDLARGMVGRFGMSAALGPMTAELPRNDMPGVIPSEETRAKVDAEVAMFLGTARARAHAVLVSRRRLLDAVVSELSVRETLQKADLARLVEGSPAVVLDGEQIPRMLEAAHAEAS